MYVTQNIRTQCGPFSVEEMKGIFLTVSHFCMLALCLHLVDINLQVLTTWPQGQSHTLKKNHWIEIEHEALSFLFLLVMFAWASSLNSASFLSRLLHNATGWRSLITEKVFSYLYYFYLRYWLLFSKPLKLGCIWHSAMTYSVVIFLFWWHAN